MRALLTAMFMLVSFAAAGQEPINHPTQAEVWVSGTPRILAPMPAAVVLIVCKTEIAGPPDQNAAYTGYENREWGYEHAMMVCRRHEVQLYDLAVDMGADPQAFTPQHCRRSAMMLGPGWDLAHKRSAYRFWRAACPVPIVRKNPDGSQDIIAWKMPDCGHRDVVRCEVDIVI